MKLFASCLFACSTLAENFEDDVCYSNGEKATCDGIARAGRASGKAVQAGGERRYADLKAISEKLWKLSGHTGKDKFDERKYWAYGCHCYLLGDRPLSEMGSGAPKVSKRVLFFRPVFIID